MNHCLFCIDVYTVNEGDTLYSIAEKYDLKAKISLDWQTEEDGRVKIVRILAKVPLQTDEKTKNILQKYLSETYKTKAEITAENE